MSSYVLGFDGGGTKTTVAALSTENIELFRLSGGALNLNGESACKVQQTVASMLLEATEKADGTPPLSVCIGAAGISNPSAESTLRRALSDAGFHGKVQIVGDHIAALAGAYGKPEGLLVIAGTGSICIGVDQNGRTARAGGRGHLIDDEGSGYAMGRDVLRAVICASDGRSAPTVLTSAVYNWLSVTSIEEIVSFAYRPALPKSEIAALAQLLPSACAQGDLAALAICKKAGGELALLVHAVAAQLSLCSGNVAMAGSALTRDSFVQSAFKARLFALLPAFSVCMPLHDAARGAALLALHLLNA
ncbi:MAG: BadF/BadG/BcrA/BcrD ATPase family protein [Ruthenibacterium sp.]